MRTEDGDLDFLVGAQLTIDPRSFAEVVKEAFRLEHDCIENQDIAEVLGVHKSRVSQVLHSPKALKPETIQKLLDQFGKVAHRRAIVRAWAKECFGEDIERPPQGELTGKSVSRGTLRRVDRQIRESRFSMAAQTAEEAASKTSDWELKQEFLDRAIFARQRLDQPGLAMCVARNIAESAEERADLLRLAAAQLLRGRTLLGLVDSRPEDLEPVFSRLRELLAACTEPSKPPAYIIGSWETLASLEVSALITFTERRTVALDEAKVRRAKDDLLEKLKQRLSQPRRFQTHVQVATAHLLLGETFQAQEQIDQAYKCGELKNLNVYESCGVVQGRILARTESPEQASKYLQGVISNCLESSDSIHHRLAEYDLARTENLRFG